MSKTTIGLRIRSIRQRLGLSQAAFGAKIGGSPRQQVSAWERDSESPSPAKLKDIALLGGVALEWLTFGAVNTIKTEPVFSRLSIPVVRKFGAGEFLKEDILREEPIVEAVDSQEGMFYFPMDTTALQDASNKSIKQGDLLLTGYGIPYFPGDLVICLTKDQRYLVRYYHSTEDGGILLKAANNSFPDIVLKPEDVLAVVRVITVKPIPFSV